MSEAYIDATALIERLHRRFLEVVNRELDAMGIRDINAGQAMMLFNLGDAEMSVGELMLRGCYLGTNVSYTVKKMIENGYLSRELSMQDRRSSRVRLTEKGTQLRRRLQGMHERHAQALEQAAVSDLRLRAAIATFRRLERFWNRSSAWEPPTPDSMSSRARAGR
jgi:DNA-binding MarR family transcriptional regulator